MKRSFVILLICGLGLVAHMALTSCRGKASSKTIEVIKNVASKSGSAAKSVGKYGDDVYRAVDKYNSNVSTTTLKSTIYQCASCAGYGQVNFVDEDGNYVFTGICPDCNGKGTITHYEYE